MEKRNLDLVDDEEILFEGGSAVLTSRRLLSRRKDRPSSGVPLDGIAKTEKISGGQESRLRPGLASAGAGIVLIAIQWVLPDSTSTLQTLLFLAGSLGVILGLHMVLTTFLRLKPHTTVLFDVLGSKEIAVSFPGRDNPQAEELLRVFTRAKRGY